MPEQHQTATEQLARIVKGRIGSKELVGRVRLAVRELMSKQEIIDLIEERLRKELLGSIDKGDTLRITPLVLKIAVAYNGPELGPGGSGDKHQHLHLHGMTEDEALAYVEGQKPKIEGT